MLQAGTLSPAYGRDYKNRASVVADLNAGKDFKYHGYSFQGYCSIRDLGSDSYQVRNAALTKVWVIKVKSGIAE